MNALRRVRFSDSISTAMRAVQYLLSGILLSLTASFILRGALGLNLIVAWLISVNAITFTFYGLDRLNRTWADEDSANAAQNVRIPEATRLLLALAGGGVAAILAILLLPRYELRKPGFLYPLVLVAAGQIVALLVFRHWIPWP